MTYLADYTTGRYIMILKPVHTMTGYMPDGFLNKKDSVLFVAIFSKYAIEIPSIRINFCSIIICIL